MATIQCPHCKREFEDKEFVNVDDIAEIAREQLGVDINDLD